jgi:hypothetical protein
MLNKMDAARRELGGAPECLEIWILVGDPVRDRLPALVKFVGQFDRGHSGSRGQLKDTRGTGLPEVGSQHIAKQLSSAGQLKSSAQRKGDHGPDDLGNPGLVIEFKPMPAWQQHIPLDAVIR